MDKLKDDLLQRLLFACVQANWPQNYGSVEIFRSLLTDNSLKNSLFMMLFYFSFDHVILQQSIILAVLTTTLLSDQHFCISKRNYLGSYVGHFILAKSCGISKIYVYSENSIKWMEP